MKFVTEQLIILQMLSRYLFDIESVPFNPLVVDRQIHVFHGLSRYGFKGTYHVEKAFAALSEEKQAEVLCLIQGKMPYSEYIELINKQHIIVDQTSSYSNGVNGIMAMAMGKVVLGGAEPVALASLGVPNIPTINIKTNLDKCI